MISALLSRKRPNLVDKNVSKYKEYSCIFVSIGMSTIYSYQYTFFGLFLTKRFCPAKFIFQRTVRSSVKCKNNCHCLKSLAPTSTRSVDDVKKLTVQEDRNRTILISIVSLAYGTRERIEVLGGVKHLSEE